MGTDWREEATEWHTHSKEATAVIQTSSEGGWFTGGAVEVETVGRAEKCLVVLDGLVLELAWM